MLRNYYINKEFILSPTARKLYRVTAAISLCLFVMIFVIKFERGVPGVLRPFVKQFLFIGAFGTATTLVGMEYFLFAYDQSSLWKKVFWFLLVTLIPLPCAALYCFRIYSRAELANTPVEKISSASA